MTPRDIACQELVELVTEYLEGALPPDEVAAIDHHLVDCDACRRYLDQMRATIAAGRRARRSRDDAGVAVADRTGRQYPGA